MNTTQHNTGHFWQTLLSFYWLPILRQWNEWQENHENSNSNVINVSLQIQKNLDITFSEGPPQNAVQSGKQCSCRYVARTVQKVCKIWENTKYQNVKLGVYCTHTHYKSKCNAISHGFQIKRDNFSTGVQPFLWSS